MVQDLRYTIRMIRKNPVFIFTIILTLALGIGANVAIFTAVEAVLLRSPAVQVPDRLVMIWDAVPKLGEHRLPMTAAQYIHYLQNARNVEPVAGFAGGDVTLTGDSSPERVTSARVSASLFPLLGVSPARGRTISSAEDQPNAARVVLLSDGLWHKRYNADPALIGKTIEIDRQPYSVIGIMPPSFIFPFAGSPFTQPAAIWVPLALTQDEIRNTGANFNINVIARLRPGVSAAQASSEAGNLAALFHRDYPELNTGNFQITGFAVRLRDLLVENVRPFLFLLLGAVGAVLLIACANVANLLLAKSLARSHEIAVRTALGAARTRLVRQLLTESTLLALMGAASGLFVAVTMIRAMRFLAPHQIGWPSDLTLDPLVLAFTLVLAVLTGIGFGLVPALRMSRMDLSNAIRESSSYTVAGPDRRGLRQMLTVGETALSVLLLIGSGLLVNSFFRVLHVPPGFNAEGVLAVHTVFDQTRYPNYQARVDAEKKILARLSAMPGATSAASATVVPLDNEIRIGIRVDSEDFKQVHVVENDLVSPDYFRAMGVPLLKGRSFSDHDLPASPLVAVVSESLARKYWEGQNPLGKSLRWGKDHAPFTVIGIVPDIRVSGLDAESLPMVYMSRFQIVDSLSTDTALVISTRVAPQNFISLLPSEVRSVDKDLPLFRIGSMSEVISHSLATRRFSMVLLSTFSLMSLLLAACGLYAVISYWATERTREFGVRLALGAPRSHVLKLVLRQATTMVATGLAIGLLAACGLSRFMHGMVYGISPLDPVTFITISLLFCLIAIVASFLPAFRAAQSDPLSTLKPQ
jgi:putative ABC transport system permease protein